jgi:hypothetical protein
LIACSTAPVSFIAPPGGCPAIPTPGLKLTCLADN